MKSILVYQDYVHNNGVLFNRLSETFGHENVRFCDAADILGGCLTSDAVAMLVMPGGADLFYCEKLNGAGNAAIRSYVEHGGTYFGICAGAYYACNEIEWAEPEGDHAICQTRELNFFKGTAIGPIYDFLEDKDFSKSWDNIVSITTPQGERSVFYNAGPVFIPASDSNHKTLASYSSLEGSPAAIIDIQVGAGRVVLSSAHIEYTSETLKNTYYAHRNSSPPWTSALREQFDKSWTPQTDIWNDIVPSLIQSNLKKAA